MPLTPKQAVFVREYVANGFNATQAYISAGYSPVGAGGHSSRLVGIGSVQAEIDRLIEAQVERTEITGDWVLAQLRSHALDPEARRSDRIRALELIAKQLGLYVERTVHLNAFVRPELAGKSIEELEAIEAALWPERAKPDIHGEARVLDEGAA